MTALTDIDKIDFTKYYCLKCGWYGSRHETDSNFFFSLLCPKCGEPELRKVTP
jgi:predicted RNA-binding Zn-ribbon protein involved in translation (DUF1610 family)